MRHQLRSLCLADGCRAETLHKLNHLLRDDANGGKSDTGLGDQFGLHNHLLDMLVNALGDGGHFVLNGVYARGDLARGLGAADGQ